MRTPSTAWGGFSPVPGPKRRLCCVATLSVATILGIVQFWSHGTAGADPRGVTVESDRRGYRPGEPVLVTIRNDLSDPIYGPTGTAICSIVAVEEWESGAWTRVGVCPEREVSFEPVVIPPGGRLTGQWGTSEDRGFVLGPIVHPTSAPRTQPAGQASRSDDEPREDGRSVTDLPEGGQARAEANRLPFSDLPGRIDAGSYRLAFPFAVGTDPTAMRVAYSAVIVISE